MWPNLHVYIRLWALRHHPGQCWLACQGLAISSLLSCPTPGWSWAEEKSSPVHVASVGGADSVCSVWVMIPAFFFFFFYPLPFDFVPILIHLWPLWQAASNSPLKGLSGWPLQDEGAEESPYCLDWDIRSYSIIIRAREEARQEETLSLGQEMSWGQPEKPFRPPLVTAPKYSASDIHF